MGKTVDMSAAYRQLGVSPSSRWVSYIAVYDPENFVCVWLLFCWFAFSLFGSSGIVTLSGLCTGPVPVQLLQLTFYENG